jgi:hypothetical protein
MSHVNLPTWNPDPLSSHIFSQKNMSNIFSLKLSMLTLVAFTGNRRIIALF